MNSKHFAESKNSEPQNSIKAVTRRILASHGNTVRLSIVTLLCILVGIVVIFTYSWLVTVILSGAIIDLPLLFGALTLLPFSILAGGFVFLFLPCVTGAVIFAKRTVRGERPRFAAVLEPFTSHDKTLYVNSILLPIAILLRVAIIFLPLVGGILNLPFVRSDVEAMSLLGMVSGCAFVLALSVLALAVGIYISSYFFFVPYLLLEGRAGLFGAFALSVRMTHGRRLEIVKMEFANIPAVILSVLSFMILWVTWAAPRMLVSYFVYCDSVAGFDNEQYYF